jgi:hypothetical protein
MFTARRIERSRATHHSQVYIGVGERCTAAHDKLGALVQLLGPNKWLIAAGEQVPAIVFSNGPAFVTDLNFNQTRGRKVDLKYLAINSHQPSRKSEMHDILMLTPADAELSKCDPHAVVYEWEFACTRKSRYTTTAPNFLRTCWWLWHLPGGLRWSRSQVQRELDTTARATYDAELLDACYLR